MHNLRQCRVCEKDTVRQLKLLTDMPAIIWPVKSVDEELKSDLELYICEYCGHLQLQEMPLEFISRLYDNTSFVETNEVSKAVRWKLISDTYPVSEFQGKRLLDVGGGVNSFFSVLEDVSAEKSVADVSVTDELTKIGVSRIYEGRFEELRLGEGEFDVLFSFHSLEHFSNPSLVVRKMFQCLNSGGLAIVEVPNGKRISEKIPYYTFFHQHNSVFNEYSLKYLFLANGFIVHSELQNDMATLIVFKKAEEGSSVSRRELEQIRGKSITTSEQIFNTYCSAIEKLETYFGAMTAGGRWGLYGAGGSSALLLAQVSELKAHIEYVFDQDSRKQGCLVPGTGLIVLSPDEISLADILIFQSRGLMDLFGHLTSVHRICIEDVLE